MEYGIGIRVEGFGVNFAASPRSQAPAGQTREREEWPKSRNEATMCFRISKGLVKKTGLASWPRSVVMRRGNAGTTGRAQDEKTVEIAERSHYVL